MGLFHCLFMLVGMLPFGFCVTEMGFSVSGFFSAFHLPLNSHSRPLAAAVWAGNLSEGRCCAPRQGFLSSWMGGLPPSNKGACCMCREHSVSCEHPSLEKDNWTWMCWSWLGGSFWHLQSCLSPSALADFWSLGYRYNF